MSSDLFPTPNKKAVASTTASWETKQTGVQTGRAWPKSQACRPRSIPPATRARLAHPAPPGQRHAQIVTIVTSLVAEGFSGEEIHRLLRPNYGPDLSDEEIVGVIRWAERCELAGPARSGGARTWNPRRAARRGVVPGAVQLDPATMVERFLKGFRCDESDLWGASPVRLGEELLRGASDLIAGLYLPGENVNIVSACVVSGEKSNPTGYGVNRTREHWLEEMALHGPPVGQGGVWIRPNPTNGCGVGNSDVVAHRFLLLEFDSIPVPLQLAFFARLPLPIAAIISSGGKSVHAWVRMDAENGDEYRSRAGEIFDLLAPFGIDRSNRNPSRLSRLPGVLRPSTGGVQALLYLNPEPANSGRAIQ